MEINELSTSTSTCTTNGIVKDVNKKLVNEIQEYVEEYLGTFNIFLSDSQQYACILMAYDNIVNECKKICTQDNIDKIIMIRHFGDEIIEHLKEINLYDEVKKIYLNGLD